MKFTHAFLAVALGLVVGLNVQALVGPAWSYFVATPVNAWLASLLLGD